VGAVNDKLQSADLEKTKVITGEATNLHQAVIAMQEAGVAFSLMVEVRNKLVESYQELMRMQV
jgi:flagellar hook-basal body complex protein FliE